MWCERWRGADGGHVQMFLYLSPAGQTVALYDPLLPAEPFQSGYS